MRKLSKYNKTIKFNSVWRKIRKCVGCNEYYVKKKAPKNKDGNKYCSRDCAYKHQKQWSLMAPSESCALPDYTQVFEHQCVNCKDLFLSRYITGVKYCSKACRYKAQLKREQLLIATRECAICGVAFSRLYGYPSTVCDDGCRATLKRNERRRHKAKRRAVKRGVNSEIVDRIKVFNRDGWKCKGCGCDTPIELMGTNHDDAPELDHVIPLSKGGEHNMLNTQCLCRTCNKLKSNLPMWVFMAMNRGDKTTPDAP